MSRETLRIMVVGAHPDDADLKAGGVAIKYAAAGHEVQFHSLTNGVAGHHEQSGATLVRRRRREAEAAATQAGIQYDVHTIRDGALQPTLANRDHLIREIRAFNPNLLLTHRPNDYHPDHRYTSQLVQDAAYMVTVPNVCPETPALETDPVIAYLEDEFQKPVPFEPDAVVAIDDVIDTKFDMLDCHESQVYEWLPYNQGIGDDVPEDDVERRAWLESGQLEQVAAMQRVADRFRDRLVERYGEEVGAQIQYAEAFEGCEYGAPLRDTDVEALFPFEFDQS